MKREYKITKSDLGYHVCRELDGRKEYLQKDGYTVRPDLAMIFYHLDTAVSALVIEKSKCSKGKEIPITSTKKSESEERREKTSWSEL